MAKPIQPIASQKATGLLTDRVRPSPASLRSAPSPAVRPLAGRRSSGRRSSPRQVLDFAVPLGEQMLAFRRGAIFGKVVVDEFDLRKIGRLWWRLGVPVGRHLVLLCLATERLRLGGQGPVVPFMRIVAIAGAFDDA